MMMRLTVRRFCFTGVVFVAMPLILAAYEQQLRELAGKMAERLAASNRKSVAVVDFTDLQGDATELGRFLAEELSVQLAMVAKGFRVIDRTHLKAILQENKLAASGVIDPQTARKLGQIAGVETLVTGNITPFGDSVRVSVKVLDTMTAEMLGASTSDVPKTKAIEELLARGIGTTVGGPGSQGTLATSAPGSTPPPAQAVGYQGFSFELESCRRSGTTVTCSLMITNQRADRDLTIELGGPVRSSRAFDDSGNEYRLSDVQIANDRATSWRLEKRMISGVRTKAAFSFENVSSQARRFTVIEIQAGASDVGWGTLMIRNVPIVP